MHKLLLLILIVISFNVKAQTLTDVNTAINKMAEDKTLQNASISFYALDLDSKKVIAELNSNTSLVPASTMKLITTSTALEVLGANKKFETTISYSGDISDAGILNGNVYIVGGGDPALGSYRYKSHYGNFIVNWASAIQKLGIVSINGQIIGDASIFSNQIIPDTWIWGDLGNYFGAGPVGLSIYENQYKISLKSKNESTLAEIIKISPSIPYLTFDTYVLSKNTKKDEAYVYGAPYQNKRTIRGAIPSNRESFTIKGSIPDPTYLAAYELNSALIKIGISTTKNPTTSRILSKKKPTTLNLITSTKSPQLSSIIKQTNLNSVNLFAEHLINQLALLKDSIAYLNNGIQVINNFWKSKGLDLNGFYMEDGSGLSRFNSITTKQLVDILTYMNTSENTASFKASLPIAGKSGTLRSLGKGTIAANNVSAKSGYMKRVRSYSGYVTTKNNRKIAFALIVNNYNCTAYQMKKKMELIMIKLAEIER